MIKERPPLVVIAGPTASGKSALAISVAERTGGVIVNADSAQVYRDLPILSAAPSTQDQARVDHRLYGALDGAMACSAADWAAMARHEIAAIHESGRVPILVGGTGLYLRTLLDGIAPVPAIAPEVRQEVRAASTQANQARLAVLDPEAANRLKPADTSRIARSLEVVLATGRTLLDWQSERVGGIADEVRVTAAILLPPRLCLYERCDDRFARMAELGAVEEVRALLARKLDPNLPVMRVIGVPELGSYLLGTRSLDEALAAGQLATRRYAKRQYTWFAHQPPQEWRRLTIAPAPEWPQGVVEDLVPA
jgi:tRNA dimethylallyltransferase